MAQRCWKCKSINLSSIRDFITITKKKGREYKYLRTYFQCCDCKTNFSRIKSKLNIYLKKRCPYCKEKKLRHAGVYYVKAIPNKRRRYSCHNCKKSINKIKLNYKWYKSSKLDFDVIKSIMTLSKLKKLEPNKWDYRKIDGNKKLLYSGSDIVKIIYDWHNVKLSRNGVLFLLRRFRNIKLRSGNSYSRRCANCNSMEISYNYHGFRCRLCKSNNILWN